MELEPMITRYRPPQAVLASDLTTTGIGNFIPKTVIE
jgi:hypothetical protein